MDFDLSDEQQAVRELSRRIFSERVSHDRLRELEAGPYFDDELWSDLCEANLTGLGMPEEVGGSGLSIFEIGVVLEEMGRHLAPVPLLPSLVLGGLTITEFGTGEQRERWLAPAATEGMVLTAALDEVGSANPARPRTRATKDGNGWRLDGEKDCVPAAERAGAILVPARTDEDDAVGVFVLDPATSGVSIERQVTTNREPHGRLTLDGARVPARDALGNPTKGAAIVEWTADRGRVALAAVQLGVCEEALRRTAEYVSGRKQFGKPIGAFQGVALRAADAYIDVQAMRGTLTEALWRLSTGRPAAIEVAVAKWWACRGGSRVTHTAQHLHGGIGSDVDYPIHRYFLWAKQIELSLGGASRQLLRIGSLLTRNGEPA